MREGVEEREEGRLYAVWEGEGERFGEGEKDRGEVERDGEGLGDPVKMRRGDEVAPLAVVTVLSRGKPSPRRVAVLPKLDERLDGLAKASTPPAAPRDEDEDEDALSPSASRPQRSIPAVAPPAARELNAELLSLSKLP